MASISTRDQINLLIDLFPLENEQEVDGVTSKIISILNDHQELKNDSELMGRIVILSAGFQNAKFKSFIGKFFGFGKAVIETNPKFVLKNLVGPMLEVKDFATLSRTSKTMHAEANIYVDRAWEKRLDEITIGEDLWRSLQARVTPEEWEQLKPNLDNIPPITREIVDFLKSNCVYYEGKKVFETHKLVLMLPDLSINNMGKLTKHLREGNRETVLDHIWSGIPAEMREEKLSQPYWAVVTTEVIPGSRRKLFEDQKELMKEGYQVPSVLEAITLATMHLESSGEKKEYLLHREPSTYTGCAEKISNYQLVVGAFVPSGLCVSGYYDGHDDVGVLALRKFC